MRAGRWIAVLALAALPSAAQVADRKELLRTPKFMEGDAKPAFRTFTEAQAKAGIQVVAQRSYAMFGYNTPEVRCKLPHVSNSSYARIEFGPATLLDAKGKEVPFELEQGGYEESKFSDEIRFRKADSDTLVAFEHARGSVKVKYPLTVKTSIITRTQPGPAALAVKIDGPYVSYNEDEAKMPETSFTKLKPFRVYDAAGHRLEQHPNSEGRTGEDGTTLMISGFYGMVARVEIDSVEDWAELDIPYDLKPAPMLPAGKEGEAPEDERP